MIRGSKTSESSGGVRRTVTRVGSNVDVLCPVIALMLSTVAAFWLMSVATWPNWLERFTMILIAVGVGYAVCYARQAYRYHKPTEVRASELYGPIGVVPDVDDEPESDYLYQDTRTRRTRTDRPYVIDEKDHGYEYYHPSDHRVHESLDTRHRHHDGSDDDEAS